MRVHRALHEHPIKWWTERLASNLWNYALRVKSSPLDLWIVQSCEWEPNLIEDASCEFNAHREVGRPCLKWDDILNKFCHIHFNSCWQDVPIELFNSGMDEFVNFYNRDVGVPIIIPPVRVSIPAQVMHRPSVLHFNTTDPWW